MYAGVEYRFHLGMGKTELVPAETESLSRAIRYDALLF